MNNFPKIIISGGGTGGHIFPAVAIADALKSISPNCEVLFVGANGRMEMEKVPAAGYQIEGLNITGIQRGSIVKNLSLPFKIVSSLRKAVKIIKRFKPHAAVGVGGYASGPLLYAASCKKVPYLIQEQNAYAGITNRLLSKGAAKICVAFKEMERFFPADKIMITGNPVRKSAVNIAGKRELGAALFNLDPRQKTILVTGGSLGADTLNKAIEKHLNEIIAANVQLIWQTGKFYYPQMVERVGLNFHPDIKIVGFLNQMDLAYAAADLIISRAGAGTIAELCLINKPVILVPSPNVAEDHQTKNALALVKNNAAVLINDHSATNDLVLQALGLLKDAKRCGILSKNIAKMAFAEADIIIAREVLKLVK